MPKHRLNSTAQPAHSHSHAHTLSTAPMRFAHTSTTQGYTHDERRQTTVPYSGLCYGAPHRQRPVRIRNDKVPRSMHGAMASRKLASKNFKARFPHSALLVRGPCLAQFQAAQGAQLTKKWRTRSHKCTLQLPQNKTFCSSKARGEKT